MIKKRVDHSLERLKSKFTWVLISIERYGQVFYYNASAYLIVGCSVVLEEVHCATDGKNESVREILDESSEQSPEIKITNY